MKRSEIRYSNLARVLKRVAREERRDFPWREEQTPYRVLLSELMLQQTQVERVREKFLLFTSKYPELSDIKKASFQELLIDWKGLGYMRRLKFLRQISETISVFPEKGESLPVLPGVGEYTRGALLAFAYNVFTPILETNIRTVLCAHFCEKGEKCEALSYKEILPKLFEETTLTPREFYEACMDYGTVLKKAKTPVCKTGMKQSAFKGSKRELRAKILFAVAHNEPLPEGDSRKEDALRDLIAEGFIKKSSTGYEIAQEVKAL